MSSKFTFSEIEQKLNETQRELDRIKAELEFEKSHTRRWRERAETARDQVADIEALKYTHLSLQRALDIATADKAAAYDIAFKAGRDYEAGKKELDD